MTSRSGAAEPGPVLPYAAPRELSSAEDKTPRIGNTQTPTC
ncbi:hypothetical protein [Arthrobacter sp. fls2-241-R2A-172]|nr:hypothetical protein [Arthrobacter sp. fls2-241-R2A-172]